MLDQIPTPPAHTVPDLRVGMLVTVCEQRDVDRLRGVLLRADARLGDHPEAREHFKATGITYSGGTTTGMNPPKITVSYTPVDFSFLKELGKSIAEHAKPPRASTVADLRFGMEVRVETREDVEALVGRSICVQSYAGTTDRHGLPCVATVTGYREVEVSRVCATSFGPFKLPLVCTLRDDVVQDAGQEYARRVQPSYPNRIKGGQTVTHSRCFDCNDTGIIPGFGFGTSVNACDRPCSCDAGKRKAEGGPSEWTVVEREVRSEPAMEDGSYSAEHVTVQRGQQVVRFRVVAHHEGDYFATVASREAKYSSGSWGCTVVHVHGEACIPMAIDRLLVGLREGTVMP